MVSAARNEALAYAHERCRTNVCKLTRFPRFPLNSSYFRLLGSVCEFVSMPEPLTRLLLIQCGESRCKLSVNSGSSQLQQELGTEYLLERIMFQTNLVDENETHTQNTFFAMFTDIEIIRGFIALEFLD